MSESALLEMRRVFGLKLVEQGHADPRIVVLDNDSGATTLSGLFEKAFPYRFFDVGIAEKNLFGTAAGLATSGRIPIAATFAVFAVRCALDQIAISIAYPALNVKIPGHYIGASRAGASHAAIEDLAVMRALPNMLVADPADRFDLASLMDVALAHDGPVYYRVPKFALPDVFDATHAFEFGRGQVLRSGSDVTIFSTGLMTSLALEAARGLAGEGVDAEVVHLGSIKPIDADLIAASVRRTGCAVTAENHSVIGGLGSAVAEVLVERYPVAMRRIGYQDQWLHSGSIADIFTTYRLRPEDIAAAARAVIATRQDLGNIQTTFGAEVA